MKCSLFGFFASLETFLQLNLKSIKINFGWEAFASSWVVTGFQNWLWRKRSWFKRAISNRNQSFSLNFAELLWCGVQQFSLYYPSAEASGAGGLVHKLRYDKLIVFLFFIIVRFSIFFLLFLLVSYLSKQFL